MSNLSSDSLFHFTSSFDNLESILENEFYPRYSLEVFKFMGKKIEMAWPMVSFCDIPLSGIKDHILTYGGYGIGMSKEWVKSVNMNPVLYMAEDSTLSQVYSDLLENAGELNEDLGEVSKMIKADTLMLVRHIKPFRGYSYRASEEVKFYDEREWRYVPFTNKDGKLIKKISKKEYKDDDFLKDRNVELQEVKLSFEPKDIKYLIVADEGEIIRMVNCLGRVKAKYDPDTIKVLTSRILTLDQIKNDF